MPYSYASQVQRKMARYYARKRCPICGRLGSGPHNKKVKGREYLYFAHSLKNQEMGRHYAKWCYVGSKEAIEEAGGVAACLEVVGLGAAKAKA